MVRLAALLLLTQYAAFAQSADARVAFEVASVKPAATPMGRGFRVTMGGDPGRLNYSNVSLKDIIAQAYQIKDYQISGPEWLSSQRFDVVAKLPPDTAKDRIPLMLQSLIAERFKLTMHREKKDLPGYALVIAKNGPKLKESPVDPALSTNGAPPTDSGVAVIGGGGRGLGGGGGQGGGRGAGRNGMPIPAGGSFTMMQGSGHIEARRQDTSSIAITLARQVDRPVVDETGLKGIYDYSLNWTPDGSEAGQRPERGSEGGAPPTGGGEGRVRAPGAPEGDSGPSLLTAIQQQLGLKLEAKKIPLDLFVVDRAERSPTEN